MDKEEIRHFKALLRQGILRHKNVLLDDKFQSELLNIIKGYEHLEQQCKKQKEVIDKLESENKVLKEQMVAMVKSNYTYGVR